MLQTVCSRLLRSCLYVLLVPYLFFSGAQMRVMHTSLQLRWHSRRNNCEWRWLALRIHGIWQKFAIRGGARELQQRRHFNQRFTEPQRLAQEIDTLWSFRGDVRKLQVISHTQMFLWCPCQRVRFIRDWKKIDEQFRVGPFEMNFSLATAISSGQRLYKSYIKIVIFGEIGFSALTWS